MSLGTLYHPLMGPQLVPVWVDTDLAGFTKVAAVTLSSFFSDVV